MAVVKCEKGHYYDNVKYKKCPHCEEGLLNIKKETYIDDLNELPTIAIQLENSSLKVQAEEITVDFMSDADGNRDAMTLGVYNFSQGTELLVGWLVATAGPVKGRDYRLYHGWNRIGRNSAMDIYIPEDKKISYDNHAAIAFDEKNMKFYILSEVGALVYLNGVHVVDTKEINNGDVIKLGDSELTFIAFCTEERRWQRN